MKKYDIWMEGFLCSGMGGVPEKAQFIATVEADSFAEACKKHYGKDEDFDEERLTDWGCRLFDTEEEARKRFG